MSSGLQGTLNQLFSTPAVPAPPVNHFYTQDPNVPVGSTWIESPHVDGADVGQYRYPSVRGWYWHHLMDHDFSIMARMTMFWINHFGMSDVGEHRAQYKYLQLFNEFGTDNFKTMIEKITVEPGMLSFLDGQSNTKWSPNENYARELLELFTIQKGPQAPGDPEDYTHYTEQDIREGAKILTGWRNVGNWSSTEAVVYSYFDLNRHTTGPKQLSHRFGNAVVHNEDNPEEEYKDFIAIIFQQAETARAFARELYKFFVHYEITSAVETDVIQPLADVIVANNFAVEPAMRALLGSAHFYEMSVRGPMIKNPYEFIVSMVRPLGGYAHLGLDLYGSGNLQTRYDVGLSHHWWASNMEMDFLYPPTVAGWKAYYQAPSFYRNWIGSATLKRRKSMVNTFTGNGIYTREAGNNNNYQPRPFDYFAFVATLAAPSDPNELIAECIDIFLPRPLHQDQIDALKNQLIPNLPDQEWSRQYGDYLASPFNPDVANPVLAKLKAFFRGLFSLAEFNLM